MANCVEQDIADIFYHIHFFFCCTAVVVVFVIVVLHSPRCSQTNKYLFVYSTFINTVDVDRKHWFFRRMVSHSIGRPLAPSVSLLILFPFTPPFTKDECIK